MLNLREFQKKPDKLTDYLPWAAFVARGEWCSTRTARFRGPMLSEARTWTAPHPPSLSQ